MSHYSVDELVEWDVHVGVHVGVSYYRYSLMSPIQYLHAITIELFSLMRHSVNI